MPVRASLSPLKPGLLLDAGGGPRAAARLKDNDGVCEDSCTLSFRARTRLELQARSFGLPPVTRRPAALFYKVDLGSGRNTR
jgi:hypothetical protein